MSGDWLRNRCKFCKKELNYNIVEDTYEFCDCLERTQKLREAEDRVNKHQIANEQFSPGYIPMAKDQSSIADTFETEIETVINKYCGQGMTIGSAIGALQNRIFNLSLNIHLPTIIEVVKRNLK